MQSVTPCIWLNDQAEEAANFYTSIFPNSKIIDVARYSEPASEVSGQTKGTVMTVEVSLNGDTFVLLNGGPIYTLTPAISFMIFCDTQEEIDTYWTKLTAGGREVRCGWLTDKFGVSWQVLPRNLKKLMSEGDMAKRERVGKALFKMIKLNILELENA